MTNLLAVGVPGLAFARPSAAGWSPSRTGPVPGRRARRRDRLRDKRDPGPGVRPAQRRRSRRRLRLAAQPRLARLLIVLVAVTAAVAIPASLVAGPLISFLVGVSIGPFILIGLVIGFDRRAVRILAMFVGAAIVLVTVLSIIGQAVKPATPAPGGGVAGPAAPPTEPGQAVAVGAAMVVLAAIVATVILARLWMRRVAVADDGIAETRTIDRGEERRPGRRTPRRRRSAPVDAVSAYLALDEDLSGDRALERRPAETPAEHARRIRAAGRRELAMDLLAADYSLARFAGVRLSDAEDRRAVGRWRALRVRLRSPRT